MLVETEEQLGRQKLVPFEKVVPVFIRVAVIKTAAPEGPRDEFHAGIKQKFLLLRTGSCFWYVSDVEIGYVIL